MKKQKQYASFVNCLLKAFKNWLVVMNFARVASKNGLKNIEVVPSAEILKKKSPSLK